ncbi:VOC family protein [Catenovulum agarivorans]|uniref:VOC family protein n=1 Tax=Catenovulum agarivorans TaxID=1172192 RepID=UPI00030108AE|nr:VOC family protein [Catenovulum agarivorans]
MKVMVIIKASSSSEAGELPSQELLTAMASYNEALVKAGIMMSGDGLKPSSEGYRIRFEGDDRTVIQGPFSETNQLIAGYWIWQVQSMEEAIEWVKKCPNPMKETSDIEIRSFYEMADFADNDPDQAVAQREQKLNQTIKMHQANLNTYLFFNGQAEAAIAYYQQHLSAELTLMMRFNESPDPIPEGMLPKGYEQKIMHAQIKVADHELFISDGCAPDEQPQGFSIALTLTESEEVERIFNALAQDGNIIMPLEKTFWSPLFGQVKDKFGISWMLMLPDEQTQ